MTDKLIKILKTLWPVAIFCLFLFVFMNMVYAQDSLGDWSKFLETKLPSFKGLPGSYGEDIAINVIRRGISLIKYFVGGLGIVMGLLYSVNFVWARGKEDVIDKYRTNFLWLFLGFVIIMVSENFANIFNPEKATSNALIDFKAADDQLRSITDYLKWLMGSIIVLLMTISGVRMVLEQGNEEKVKKEKDNLIYSGIGMLVILLASNIVNAIYVVKNPDTIVAGNATLTINEIGSVIRLLLVFLGPVTIIFTIAAGFWYLTAFENEEQAKNAKNMIIAGITGIVIIYVSYALVNTFMIAKLTPNVTPTG